MHDQQNVKGSQICCYADHIIDSLCMVTQDGNNPNMDLSYHIILFTPKPCFAQAEGSKLVRDKLKLLKECRY